MTEKTDIRHSDEKVVEIEMERLRTFMNHPFKVQILLERYAHSEIGGTFILI